MSIRNSVASALAVLLMAAALPACGQSSPPQARGGGKLSPEEQAMMFRDARDKMSAMSPDQRKAYHQQLKQQWASESPAQQQQQRAQLDSEWQALPQPQKDKMEARIQQREAKQNGGGQAQNGSAPSGESESQ
ncbi:MAG TPA: hypothetical protein VK759_01085 [Rhizomicrobium sp.]|jgi:hypothetical protein|nr:hypothetical protein [Rhizomicrobium sp.]